jgi:hypothetical protein
MMLVLYFPQPPPHPPEGAACSESGQPQALVPQAEESEATVPHVQSSVQRLSGVQAQSASQPQLSEQPQAWSQVQPSLQRWSAVHVQSPPHEQSSVQAQETWLLFSAKTAGRPRPTMARTAAAMRSFFTGSPFRRLVPDSGFAPGHPVFIPSILYQIGMNCSRDQ